MSQYEIDTGVALPDDGVIDITWAQEQLESISMFSQELLAFGRGKVFFMLQSNLSDDGYAQSIKDLGYTVETAATYISYLQKRTILEAIKAKFYVALSLSAAEYLPDDIEDAMALMDVCAVKYGKPTAENLKKAAEATGVAVKKMSDSLITVEAMKKKALAEWLKEEYGMTESDIIDAQKLKPEGRVEFMEKMTDAYDRLEDFMPFYNIVAEAVHKSENIVALRFLADIRDASGSMLEFLAAERANNKLTRLKQMFENEVYPKLQVSEEE